MGKKGNEPKENGSQWRTRGKISLDTVSKVHNLCKWEVSHLACCSAQPQHRQPNDDELLYDEEDVKKLAQLKSKQHDYWLEEERQRYAIRTARIEFDHQMEQELKDAKAAAIKGREQRFRAECAAKVVDWQKGVRLRYPYTSGSALPLELWEKILNHLSDDLEPYGVRGLSVVARDLANASMVSKELRAAAQPAFLHLSLSCPNPSSIYGGLNTQLWREFASDPASQRLEQIKALAKLRGLKLSQPKPVLTVALMNSLQLLQPTQIPVSLMLAIACEKQSFHSPLARLCCQHTSFKGRSAFQIRQLCLKMSRPNLKSLKEAQIASDYAWDAYEEEVKIRLHYEKGRAARLQAKGG